MSPDQDREWKEHLRWLYLRTVDDLDERSALDQQDAYAVLGIAALIRRLLVDASPLAPMVSRGRGLPKPEFELRPPHTADEMAAENPMGRSASSLMLVRGECLDPVVPCSKGQVPRQVGIDGLLREVMAYSFGTPVSVRQFLKQYEVLEGAVHVGKPANAAERDLFMAMRITGRSPRGNSTNPPLRALGRVVVEGLRPLTDQVRD